MPSITIGIGGGVAGLQALGEPLAAVVTSEEVSQQSASHSLTEKLQPIPTPPRTTQKLLHDVVVDAEAATQQQQGTTAVRIVVSE